DAGEAKKAKGGGEVFHGEPLTPRLADSPRGLERHSAHSESSCGYVIRFDSTLRHSSRRAQATDRPPFFWRRMWALLFRKNPQSGAIVTERGSVGSSVRMAGPRSRFWQVPKESDRKSVN